MKTPCALNWLRPHGSSSAPLLRTPISTKMWRYCEPKSDSFANPLPLHEGSPIFAFNKSKNLKQRWTASTRLFRPHGANHSSASASCWMLINQVGTPIVCQVVQIAALVRSRTTHFNKYLASSPRDHLSPLFFPNCGYAKMAPSQHVHGSFAAPDFIYRLTMPVTRCALAVPLHWPLLECQLNASKQSAASPLTLSKFIHEKTLSYPRHSLATQQPLTSASFNAMYRLSITALAHHLPTPHLLVSILLGIESSAIQRPRLAVYSYSTSCQLQTVCRLESSSSLWRVRFVSA